jgi:hypothetical protein
MKNSSSTEPHSPTIQPVTAERTGPAEQAQAQLAAIVTSSDDAILSKSQEHCGSSVLSLPLKGVLPICPKKSETSRVIVMINFRDPLAI